MPSLDYRHLSPAERLNLIGEIWDSIETDHVPLNSAQAAMLVEDIKYARPAEDVFPDLRRRYS